jgi:hypothetical protein
MDANRFDATTRLVFAAASRRRTLGSLLGAALAALGLIRPNQTLAKSGKCKPKCGECERCKKGDCNTKNGKKRCKKGKCRPKRAGTPCTAFVGGACQNGTCFNLKADEANCGSLANACGPSQVCQEGSCFPTSTCPAGTTRFSYCSAPFTTCGTGCSCARSVEGNVLCLADDDDFCRPGDPDGLRCTTSADCPVGRACVDVSGCCPADPAVTKGCVLPCAAPAG